jgi:hypothetical protein
MSLIQLSNVTMWAPWEWRHCSWGRILIQSGTLALSNQERWNQFVSHLRRDTNERECDALKQFRARTNQSQGKNGPCSENLRVPQCDPKSCFRGVKDIESDSETHKNVK